MITAEAGKLPSSEKIHQLPALLLLLLAASWLLLLLLLPALLVGLWRAGLVGLPLPLCSITERLKLPGSRNVRPFGFELGTWHRVPV